MEGDKGEKGLKRHNILVIMIIFSMSIIPAVNGEVRPDQLKSGIGRFSSIICSDIDSDGRKEIVFGSYDGFVTSVEYRGGDYYVDWTSERYGTRTWGIIAGQFDDDENLELVIGDGDGIVRVLDGRTKEQEWRSVTLDRDAHGLLLHDVDGDGINELMVGTGFKTDQGWGQVYFFRNNSSEPFRTLPETWNSRLRELDISDLDNDGEEELIVSSGAALGDVKGEGYFRVYDLQTLEVEFESEDLQGCVEGMKIRDLDSDGTPEIIVSNGYRYREGWCFIFSWNGETYEMIWKSGNIGPKVYGMDVKDVDSDGTIEIVLANMAGFIFVFDGLTREKEWTSGELGRDILGLVIEDVDGDGEQEIIAGQGGYIGKGDYTSGYVTPHVYVIDGKTKTTEAVLGDIDEVKQWMIVVIIILSALALIQLALISRLILRKRRMMD
jgi:WD40 repeat protein